MPMGLRRTGRGLNGIEMPPEPAERAAASATNPTPIAAERVLTTRTAGLNSRAACTAELYVLDSAAERCTATTPSPSLSLSACW